MKHVEIVINRTPCEHSIRMEGKRWSYISPLTEPYYLCGLDAVRRQSEVATHPCSARDFCSCPLNTKEMRLEAIRKKVRKV